MKPTDFLHDYNVDLPLMDAMKDDQLSITRRLLARALVGSGYDEACYSTQELLETFLALQNDHRKKITHGEGYLMAEAVLDARNPLQMRLWYILDRLEVGKAFVELGWLKGLALRRAGMVRQMHEAGIAVPRVPSPHGASGSVSEMMAVKSPFDA